MQTLSHSNAVPQKPGRNIATIAMVGTLHIAVIYAILVSIGTVPIPHSFSPGDFKFIDTKPTATPPIPVPHPIIPTTIPGPTIPDPTFQIDHGNRGPITVDGGGEVGSQGMFVAASAIASTHTIPSYPALDRRLDHQGSVRLTLSIDAQGNVVDAIVAHSSGYEGLDAAAVEWVKAHWRYQPATRDGIAVPASAQADVTFKLTQG